MLFGQKESWNEKLGSENTLQDIEEIGENQDGNKDRSECIIWGVFLNVDWAASEVNQRECFADTQHYVHSVLVRRQSLTLVRCLCDLGK